MHTMIDDGIHSVVKYTDLNRMKMEAVPTRQSSDSGSYLLLCTLDLNSYTTRLTQIDLRFVESDQKLFDKIRRAYKTRGARATLRSTFTTPSKIHCVKACISIQRFYIF